MSQRFYGLVSRLHYARVVDAVSLKDYELLLECYHPSAKISTPYMFCDYLGSDGLGQIGLSPTLKGINGLYSRYRPVLGEEHRRPRARYATRAVIEGMEPAINDSPSHELYLEASELFSQLVTVVNLIKIGPKRGLFLSYVNLTEKVSRLHRPWLAEESSRLVQSHGNDISTTPASTILWTDESHNFGIKVRVIDKSDEHMPIMVGPGEDPPASYVLEYEGMPILTNPVFYERTRADLKQNCWLGQINSWLVWSSRRLNR